MCLEVDKNFTIPMVSRVDKIVALSGRGSWAILLGSIMGISKKILVKTKEFFALAVVKTKSLKTAPVVNHSHSWLDSQVTTRFP